MKIALALLNKEKERVESQKNTLDNWSNAPIESRTDALTEMISYLRHIAVNEYGMHSSTTMHGLRKEVLIKLGHIEREFNAIEQIAIAKEADYMAAFEPAVDESENEDEGENEDNCSDLTKSKSKPPKAKPVEEDCDLDEDDIENARAEWLRITKRQLTKIIRNGDRIDTHTAKKDSAQLAEYILSGMHIFDVDTSTN